MTEMNSYYKDQFARVINCPDVRIKMQADHEQTNWINFNAESTHELVKLMCGYFGASIVLSATNEFINESMDKFKVSREEKDRVLLGYRSLFEIKE